MPFVYAFGTSTVAENFTSSATPNTPIESVRVNPGAGRACAFQSFLVAGKGAALTTLSGLVYRLRKWTTTAAAGGTNPVPLARDVGAQAPKHTAGAASAGVTAGTGGPSYLGGCSSGGASPGGWVASNADSMPVLEAGAAHSFGIWVASGSASMSYEIPNVEIVE